MLAGLAAVPLAHADGLKHRKHRVDRHIKVASGDLDESSKALRQAAARLAQAQSRLEQAQSYLSTTEAKLTAAKILDRQMQAKLVAAEQQLAQARAAVQASREKVAGQRRTLGELVAESYQSGSPQLMGLSMMLTTQDPAQLTGQLNSVHSVLDKESGVLGRLQAAKVLLTVQERQVHRAEIQVAQRRAAAAANLARKQGLERAAKAAEEEVAGLVTSRAKAKRAAVQANRADMAELRHLKRKQDHLEAMLKARAARLRARALARASAGSLSTAGSNGYLSWPVNGPVTSGFGWRIHPIFGYRSFHDGIDIAAGCGTPIRAPASGRVLQEYYQTAWGNRIVLDLGFHHGVGLAAILNHLSRYAVRAGVHVHRGEVIGYIGSTGWSTGCHTHFTVMANGRPVNPLGWL
jgi:murein DD-endopeptidase MepM/ murein hydrolase activator NlpD